MRAFWMIALICVLPMAAGAEERLVRLYAPPALVETGLLKHLLPRFSLKTQVKVELAAAPDTADMILGETGRPLFEGVGRVWHMALIHPDHPGTARFADWLTSEIGQRAALGFAPEGVPLFAAPQAVENEVVEIAVDGNAKAGYDVSRVQCARCHAVDEAGRKNDIGSTPSFFVLRAMGDWQERFEAFYVLKPHAAFTQISGVTEPFPENRPSPIVPVELTLDDLENVLAYVAALKAADLGAPIQHQ